MAHNMVTPMDMDMDMEKKMCRDGRVLKSVFQTLAKMILK